MSIKSWENCLWKAVPYGMALFSLVGFLFVLVNPLCWFSPGEGECTWFASGNAWKSYDGQDAGLQFFGTVFLAAATLFTWPALRAQIASCSGQLRVDFLKFCFNAGYSALLIGIGTDMYSQNRILTDSLITTIGIGFALTVSSFGGLFILFAIWTIIRVALFLVKELFSLIQRALASLHTYIRCLRPQKPP